MVTMAPHEWSARREREIEPGTLTGLLLRCRGLVVLAALVLMILAGIVGRDAADKLVSGAYLDPSAESQRAAEVLTEQFPGGPSNLVLIAEARTDTVDSPQSEQAGRDLTRQLTETEGVAGVQSYWTTPDPSLRGPGGRSALIALQLTGGEHTAQQTAGRIVDSLEQTSNALRVSASGPAAVGLAVDEQAESDLISAEKVTLPITLLVLLLVFGSAIAAGLPLLVGAVRWSGRWRCLGCSPRPSRCRATR
jgi:RND superfamily putative drug exporter